MPTGPNDPSSAYPPAASGGGPEGTNTIASGVDAHAEGTGTHATGAASHAEGQQTIASGVNAHAEGQQNAASGARSHAEGQYCAASGDTSHAEGLSTKALGMYSHAEGRDTWAAGEYSHAEGEQCRAFGVASHAEGGAQSQAEADYAHAEGYATHAGGISSHAEGQQTYAAGVNSHAGGQSARADHYGQWARASGMFDTAGDGQTSTFTLMAHTTDAAPTALTLNGPNASGFINPVSATDSITLKPSRGYAFHATVVATAEGLDAFAGYTLTGMIASPAQGDAQLIGDVDLVTKANAAFDALGAQVVAAVGVEDTSYLALVVTGAAAQAIRWVARVDVTEVG
jgi:hypothetical protein